MQELWYTIFHLVILSFKHYLITFQTLYAICANNFAIDISIPDREIAKQENWVANPWKFLSRGDKNCPHYYFSFATSKIKLFITVIIVQYNLLVAESFDLVFDIAIFFYSIWFFINPHSAQRFHDQTIPNAIYRLSWPLVPLLSSLHFLSHYEMKCNWQRGTLLLFIRFNNKFNEFE